MRDTITETRVVQQALPEMDLDQARSFGDGLDRVFDGLADTVRVEVESIIRHHDLETPPL